MPFHPLGRLEAERGLGVDALGKGLTPARYGLVDPFQPCPYGDRFGFFPVRDGDDLGAQLSELGKARADLPGQALLLGAAGLAHEFRHRALEFGLGPPRALLIRRSAVVGVGGHASGRLRQMGFHLEQRVMAGRFNPDPARYIHFDAFGE